MRSIRHDGRRTAYRVADRGPAGATLVFVHGSGGTHEVWTSQLSRLASEYRVVALDLSGHGESDDVPTTDGPTARDRYVEDVLAVTEAVGGDVLIGTSLGGAIVLSVLLDGDLGVEAAVLAGSGATLAVQAELRGWLAEDFERAIDFLLGEDRLFHDPDPRLETLSREAMRAVGRRVTERDFLASHSFDERERIDEIATPTLAMTGEYDRLTPPTYHEYLATEISDGTWTTLPDAAHLAMLEVPDLFNAALREFLDER